MKAKKSKSKKNDKAKLAAGAEEIKAAQKEAKNEEPLTVPETKKSTEDIVRERVKILPGNLGLEISDATPVEESLKIVDWTMQLSNHVGFMVGDALNFGNSKWGDKYTEVLNRTGRAYSTLAGYAETSRKIPYEKRMKALSFTHHREILRLQDDSKIDKMLKEVAHQFAEGHKPSAKDVRYKVQKEMPRKPAPKRVTSGKGKGGKKKEVLPPYEPTESEQSTLDIAETAIGEVNTIIKEEKPAKIVMQLDTKEKQRWLKLLQPVYDFYNALDRVTGSYR